MLLLDFTSADHPWTEHFIWMLVKVVVLGRCHHKSGLLVPETYDWTTLPKSRGTVSGDTLRRNDKVISQLPCLIAYFLSSVALPWDLVAVDISAWDNVPKGGEWHFPHLDPHPFWEMMTEAVSLTPRAFSCGLLVANTDLGLASPYHGCIWLIYPEIIYKVIHLLADVTSRSRVERALQSYHGKYPALDFRGAESKSCNHKFDSSISSTQSRKITGLEGNQYVESLCECTESRQWIQWSLSSKKYIGNYSYRIPLCVTGRWPGPHTLSAMIIESERSTSIRCPRVWYDATRTHAVFERC